ncbi:MAG: hypothetical protein ISS65_08775 [Desulfobacterales bacterium]|uniref:RNA polymerase sigma factor 54 DNA-binding domain-containing protein n=1 Tax=Candidatus Desulfatibia profunda TaxID=2841695 RepID=A0A8J6NKL0_9BACT|nr:hypothetical protein [Candidatus Desulfatibia profunda]MBL7180284.1 hypothetical protein [Desulfobacterales bacterium]
MEHSKETIARIKKFIRSKQKNFLKTKELAPLTQTECAAHVGVNVSTVSRILASGIKIKFGRSEYPLSYFFSQRNIHPQVFNEWIHNVIKEEDPANPFSDDRLLRRFKKEFPQITLSLRTIKKYRMDAGIGSGDKRRITKLVGWISKKIESEDPENPLTDKLLIELFHKEHPGSNINDNKIAKFRKKGGIEGFYKRRKKINR